MRTTDHTQSIAKKNLKVKGIMATLGITQTSIAEKFDVRREAVSRVVLGRSTSARIRAEIAIRCGTTVQKLWPAKRRAARA